MIGTRFEAEDARDKIKSVFNIRGMVHEGELKFRLAKQRIHMQNCHRMPELVDMEYLPGVFLVDHKESKQQLQRV